MCFDSCFKKVVELPSKINILDNRVIHIAFGVNNKYVPYAGTAVFSILENNKKNLVCFHIIRDEFSNGEKLFFEKLLDTYPNSAFKIYIINQDILKGLPKNSYWNHSIYYRALAPLGVKDVASKVLYLDADILCRKDLTDLWNVDVTKNIAAVVEDGLKRSERKRWFSNYGIEKDVNSPVYFNSGVMLINVEKYLSENIFLDFIELLNEIGKEFRYFDQDAFNILLNKEVLYLDFRYNCQPNNMRYSDSAIIVHWCGIDKPWNSTSELGCFGEWLSYYRRSPWGKYPLPTMKPKTSYIYKYEAAYYFDKGNYVNCFMSLVRGFCLKYTRIRF